MNLTVENNQVIVSLSVEEQTAANAIAAGQRAFLEAERSRTEADRSETAKADTEQLKADTLAARTIAETKATEATTEATTATNKATEATTAAQQTAADRVQTGQDRFQTSQDRQATAADRTQTGQDRAATAQDRLITAGHVTSAAGHAANALSEANRAAEDRAVVEVLKNQVESFSNNTGVYGVEWNRTFPTTVCTRVGDMSLHHAVTGLPVHNRMRRCLLLDNGTVNYYLDPNDSTKRDDGTASKLDGTDGQVMVEIPEHWRRFDTDGDIQRVLIAEAPFRGSHRVPKAYVSAFEASVFRPTNTLSSVINTSPDYRGGNNNSAWDSEDRSLLGMPATVITRINFLAFARNRGANWHSYLYEIHKTLFWLYLIEHANRNSQLGYNPDLTVEGFRQGGLGAGVTNYLGSVWNSFNSYYPIFQCGTGALDNFSHSIAVTHPVLGATQIPQYRGIEHPFGHIWKWTEGVNVRNGNNRSMVYKANSFNFRSSDYQGYEYAGDLGTISSYIREISFGRNGDLFASNVTGASSTTFWADYLYQSIPPTGESLRGLLFGGSADGGARAGFVCSNANIAPSYTITNIGSRLCFAEQMGA